jgi:hypothetical protein
MDSRQAKEVLTLYRPGNTDAADPQIAEALEVVQRDPELAAWFNQHCAVYNAIRGKLKEIPVPADLKHRILAQHVDHRRIIRLFRPAWLATAAAALIVLTAIFWFMSPNKENTFVRYRERMARMVQRRIYFTTMVTGDQTQIGEFFRTNGAPVDDALPKALQKLPAEGGAVVPWQNHPIAVLCLDAREKSADAKNDLWIFMAKSSDIPKVPHKKATQFEKIGGLMTASWTAGDTVYLLVGRGDERELQKYLE